MALVVISNPPMIYNAESLLVHVKGCAEYLDQVKPGWENQIDFLRLDFSSNTRCVVGQLWGHVRLCSYWHRITALWPLAVMSQAAIPLWQAEVEARRGVFEWKPLTFPKEWETERVDAPIPVSVD